jgi:hypothetical protein
VRKYALFSPPVRETLEVAPVETVPAAVQHLDDFALCPPFERHVPLLVALMAITV